jgi:hypothetical protein
MSMQLPLTSEALREELQHLLRHFNSLDSTPSPLQAWLIVRRGQHAAALARGEAVRRCLQESLSALAAANSEGAAILRRHYLDDVEVHAIARELALVEGTINKKQRLAIAQLADLMLAQETAARSAKAQRVAQRLGAPTYTRLFGAAALAEQINAPLQVDGPPWLVAIDGIGGIGKTAVADWLLRTHALDARWQDMAWVVAAQQLFSAGGALRPSQEPALTPDALFDALYQQLLAGEETPTPPAQERRRQVRKALKMNPYLVVLDNLERVADVDALLDVLTELADPSKFLLTTRFSLHHAAGVFNFHTPELSLQDAQALLRSEAQVRNLPGLAAASDEELAAIYAAAGGNPLALRLIAGQTHVHDLATVLAGLQQANSRHAERLYTHIYRHAWERLDERARQVLLLMPLTTENGAGAEFLRGVSGLEPAQLQGALEQLVALNLVDSRGGLRDRHYSIHSLTRTFLLQQVLQW